MRRFRGAFNLHANTPDQRVTQHVPRLRHMLAQLAEQMTQTNRPVGRLNRRLNDGTLLSVWWIYGAAKAAVEVPIVESEPPETEVTLLTGFLIDLRDSSGTFPPDDNYQAFAPGELVDEQVDRIYSTAYDKYAVGLPVYGTTEAGDDWYIDGMFGGNVDWQNKQGDILTFFGPPGRYFEGDSTWFTKKVWYKGVEFFDDSELPLSDTIGAAIATSSAGVRYFIVIQRSTTEFRALYTVMPTVITETSVTYNASLTFTQVATLDLNNIESGTYTRFSPENYWWAMYFDPTGTKAATLFQTRTKVFPYDYYTHEIDFTFDPDTLTGEFTASRLTVPDGDYYDKLIQEPASTTYLDQPVAGFFGSSHLGDSVNGRPAYSGTLTKEAYRLNEDFFPPIRVAVDWDDNSNKVYLWRQESYYDEGWASSTRNKTLSAAPSGTLVSGKYIVPSETVETSINDGTVWQSRTIKRNGYKFTTNLARDSLGFEGAVNYESSQFSEGGSFSIVGTNTYTLNAVTGGYDLNSALYKDKNSTYTLSSSGGYTETQETGKAIILWADLRHDIMVFADIKETLSRNYTETSSYDDTGTGATPAGVYEAEYPYFSNFEANADYDWTENTTEVDTSSELKVIKNGDVIYRREILRENVTVTPDSGTDSDPQFPVGIDGSWTPAANSNAPRSHTTYQEGAYYSPWGVSTWRNTVAASKGGASIDWSFSEIVVNSRRHRFGIALLFDANQQRTYLLVSYISDIVDGELKTTVIDIDSGVVVRDAVSDAFGVPNPEVAPVFPVSIV